MSKLRSKVAVSINDKGIIYTGMTHVIESLQFLANPHLVFCFGMRIDMEEANMRFFVYTITVMIYHFFVVNITQKNLIMI